MSRAASLVLLTLLLTVPAIALTPGAAASGCAGPIGVDWTFCTAHVVLNVGQALVNCFYARPPSQWLNPCYIPL